MSTINQKEYLKKYLGIGKGSGTKKKKKKPKGISNRVTIIDDDVDVDGFKKTTHAELNDEDAPQIVAVIDERPLLMRFDDDNKRALWEPIGTAREESPATSSSPKHSNLSFKIETTQTIKEEARDSSPPRRRNMVTKEDDLSPPRHKKESDDLTPPRRKRKFEDFSPPRRSRNHDLSPKIQRRPNERDISPRRQNRKDDRDNRDDNRRQRRDSGSLARGTSRRDEENLSKRKSRWNREDTAPSTREEESYVKQEKCDDQPSSSKLQKTLDGKTAGLQNAKELSEETRKFREREDELFRNLSKDVSGQNAQTVVRSRKSGKVRDLEAEDAQKRKRAEEEEQQKEKYMRWGRGLVQVENRTRQIEEEIHEMSKPMARYADDEDLENYLKGQDREGDPMLAYLRSKRKKENIKAGKPEKPQFLGEFLPNRFSIRPGHRWDGVDRSNGYEKKWFTIQNEKRAQQEDNYKWSTEDL